MQLHCLPQRLKTKFWQMSQIFDFAPTTYTCHVLQDTENPILPWMWNIFEDTHSNLSTVDILSYNDKGNDFHTLSNFRSSLIFQIISIHRVITEAHIIITPRIRALTKPRQEHFMGPDDAINGQGGKSPGQKNSWN